MAIITSPTPDISNNQNVNEKIEVLLNSYYMLRKEIEFALQHIGISNLGTDLTKKISSAEGKITTYAQAEMPATGNVGDLWIDTNDSYKLYRHNGVQWISAADTRIDSVVDEEGNLMAAKIAGIINTAVAMVQNSTGQVKFDDRGFIVHDQATEELSTKALLLSSGGILIANSKDVNGDWEWKTAITGDSINASAITAGILTAITINGVTITGSSITSADANSEIKLLNGIFSIKKKLTSQQFNMNYRAGLPAGVTQAELEYYDEFKASNPSKPAENTISLNSANSHMGLEFGNGAVGMGNDWAKISMYGGTTDWQTAWPTFYAEYYASHQGDPIYNPPPDTVQGSKMIIDLIGNYWVYKEAQTSGQYTIPALVLGNSYFVVNAHYTQIENDCEVFGNFEVHGTKDCTIMTEQFGKLNYSAYETAEIYLGDIGEGEVIGGECVINLDEKLLACINTELPYQVFLQAYGDGRVYVSQRNATNFIVKGDNIKFAWEIKAKRKNYENVRFGNQNNI